MTDQQLIAVMAIVDAPLSDGTTLRRYARIRCHFTGEAGDIIAVTFTIPKGTTMPPDALGQFDRMRAIFGC